MNNNCSPFLLPYSPLYRPIDFSKFALETKITFGRATNNPECPHAPLHKPTVELFWGISQFIGRYHLEFLYNNGRVRVRTFKKHHSARVARNSTSINIKNDEWLELQMLDVVLIRKYPVYLFIQHPSHSFANFSGFPQVDPILVEINRRLQTRATRDNRERIVGPTPLGSGSFGHVFPLGSRFLPYQNWELKALKVLNVQSKQSFDNILREITLLERCREHQSLLRFEKTFYIERNDGSPPLVCLETEFCNGGDLISFLKRINKQNLCEFDVGIIILQLAAAVQFLQTNPGIIHRDIKPENVLIKTETDAMGNFVLTVKLADFGLSTLSEKKEAFERTTRIGTIQYMAPEMLMGEPYDCRIDNYGVGLVAYFLSSGVHPYDGPDNFHVFLQHVISNSINFEPRVWNDRRLSKDAIVGIIQSCQTKRMMIHDFIRHPWFLHVLENDTQSRRFIEYHKAVCNTYTPPPPVLINRRAIFPDPNYSQNSSLFSQPRMSQF